jgi:hypothetical protein
MSTRWPAIRNLLAYHSQIAAAARKSSPNKEAPLPADSNTIVTEGCP